MKTLNLADLKLDLDDHLVLLTACRMETEFIGLLKHITRHLSLPHMVYNAAEVSDEYKFRCGRLFWPRDQMPPDPWSGFCDLLNTAMEDIIVKAGIPIVILASNLGTRHSRELILQSLESWSVAYLVNNPKLFPKKTKKSKNEIGHPIMKARERALFQEPDDKELKELCVPAYTWYAK